MKSYILGTYISDSYENLGSTFTVGDFFNKNYSSFINASSFYQTYVTADNVTTKKFLLDSTTAANALQKSNTKELIFNRVSTSGSYTSFHYAFAPNKTDSQSYNTLMIKFNKLNPTVMGYLKNSYRSTSTSVQIHFSDTNTFNSGVYTAPGLTSHSTPLADFPCNINKECINWEEGYILLTPTWFATAGFPKRSGGSDGTCYHRYFCLSMPNLGSSCDQFTLGNVFVGNSLQIEIENGVNIDYENMSQKTESNQGVSFTDILNTRKKMTIRLPMLTVDEYINLDTNFFKKHKDKGFILMPLDQIFENSGDSNYIYRMVESKNLAGYYEFDMDTYSVERQYGNVFNISIKIKEVI